MERTAWQRNPAPRLTEANQSLSSEDHQLQAAYAWRRDEPPVHSPLHEVLMPLSVLVLEVDVLFMFL